MPMKNSNDTIGKRTHDLPACNSVPQPTALPILARICYLVLVKGKVIPITGLCGLEGG